MVWAVLQPLSLVALYWFVFTFMIPGGRAGGSGDVYIYVLIAGLIPWLGFIEGLIRSTTAIVENVGRGEFGVAIVYGVILLGLAFVINALLVSVQRPGASWAHWRPAPVPSSVVPVPRGPRRVVRQPDRLEDT